VNSLRDTYKSVSKEASYDSVDSLTHFPQYRPSWESNSLADHQRITRHLCCPKEHYCMCTCVCVWLYPGSGELGLNTQYVLP
jgi:hypothetical protein